MPKVAAGQATLSSVTLAFLKAWRGPAACLRPQGVLIEPNRDWEKIFFHTA